jgi:hypothetical protein
MGTNNYWNFLIITLKEVMHKKMPCFIPQRIPLTNQIHLKNEQDAWVIHLMGITQ